MNVAARSLLGLQHTAQGKLVDTVIRKGELSSHLARAAREGGSETCEMTIEGRHLLVLTRPFHAPEAAAADGVLAVIVDLTELRRLESVRRDFVANVSHELKTPLTSIRGYSETLLGDDLDEETRRRFLETIERNAERLQRIVDDLLDLSRLESGGWVPELVPLDPVAVAEDAWSGFRDRAGAAGIAFDIDCAAPLPIVADPSGLRQIFCNLYDNALRYTPRGGSIAVRIGAPAPALAGSGAGGSRRVTVEVRDSGSGIPRDALPRIFERFYRVDPARSRAEGGTGLGLSIVKHLAESMGGDVSAESALGRGTIIRFRLPAAELPSAVSRSA
jgi:two-component system phosphate regulon sensor histidine kinase PhoR